jgi:lipopolysaccharide/colanic/teichoic acid biosynthesis glycosyltransferase
LFVSRTVSNGSTPAPLRRRSLRVLVVGDRECAALYKDFLRRHPQWELEVVGALSPPASTAGIAANFNGGGETGDRDYWVSALSEFREIDELVATVPWPQAAHLDGLGKACVDRGIAFRVLVQTPPSAGGRVFAGDTSTDSHPEPLDNATRRAIPLFAKRALDIVGSLFGLILCGLVYLWYAPRLKRQSPGPVLFKQLRSGKDGRFFTVYKFRTMYPDAEAQLEELQARNEMIGAMFKLRDDPRIVPVGRTLRKLHLDETPQFYNVLRGEMSLVGPRPSPITEVALYQSHQLRRLRVKPGITGPFQVNGHEAVSDFEQIVKLDCEYIDGWSLLGDLRLIAQTVVKVAQADGW